MSVLLVVANPNPTSLNHALGDRIISVLADGGVTVHAHDLYREHFEPVLENEEIQRRFAFDDLFVRYSRELRAASGLVFIYPDWWGMPPAILKGWLDRIFRPGLAYEFEGEEFMPKEKVALLRGKRALVVTTTNETNPLSQTAMCSLWRDRIFSYVGVEDVVFKTLYAVRDSTGRERKAWIEEVSALARRWMPGESAGDAFLPDPA